VRNLVVDLTDPRTVVWGNDPLILFHGTVVDSAASVIRRVRLPTGTRAGGWDFGRGVYFHISREAAEEWADSRADQRGQQPQVVEIAVDRAQFGALRSIVFLSAPSAYDPNDLSENMSIFAGRGQTPVLDADLRGRRPRRTPTTSRWGRLCFSDIRHIASHIEPYVERAAAPGVRVRQRRLQICCKTEAAIALLNGSSRRLVGS
jgi:hypothetical protein